MLKLLKIANGCWFHPHLSIFLAQLSQLAPNTTILSTSNGLGGHLGLPFLLQVQQFAKATPPGKRPRCWVRVIVHDFPQLTAISDPEQRSAFLLKAARRLGRWGSGGCCMDGVKLVKHGETGETQNEI
jgi:hypothetical protein